MSKKLTLIFIMLAMLGAALILVPTSQFGIGLTPDSVGYISTARNLISGDGFVQYDGTPFYRQPPLYPLLLAFSSILFQKDPLILADILNALIFGLVVFFGGRLSFTYLSESPVFSLLCSAAILASFPLFQVSVMAWSEALFILLVTMSILFAHAYLETHDRNSLLLLSLFTALSILTRYIGVILVVWGAWIIFASWRNGIKNSVSHLAVFTSISLFPIGLWLIRNYSVSNSFLGARPASSYTLFQNLTFVYDEIVSWYVLPIFESYLPGLVLIGAAAGLLIVFNPKKGSLAVGTHIRRTSPIGLFIVFYLAILVIFSTTTAYNQIDERLLSPIYIPLTILGIIFAKTLVEAYRRTTSFNFLKPLMVVGVLIWISVIPLRNTINDAADMYPIGRGFGNIKWQKSQTVQYLKETQGVRSECAYYSNAPDILYILANVSSKMSPRNIPGGTSEAPSDSSAIGSSWFEESDQVCLIWLDRVNRDFLITPDELQSEYDLKELARFNDGAIYSVTRN